MKPYIPMRCTGSLLHVQTRDAMLTTPTPAESAANARRVAKIIGTDLGLVWDGVTKSPDPAAVLGRLAADVRDALVEEYGSKIAALADYVASVKKTSSPDLNVITDRRAQARDSAEHARATRDLISSINAANARHCRANDVTSAPTRPGSNIAAINAANAAYWAQQRG